MFLDSAWNKYQIHNVELYLTGFASPPHQSIQERTDSLEGDDLMLTFLSDYRCVTRANLWPKTEPFNSEGSLLHTLSQGDGKKSQSWSDLTEHACSMCMLPIITSTFATQLNFSSDTSHHILSSQMCSLKKEIEFPHFQQKYCSIKIFFLQVQYDNSSLQRLNIRLFFIQSLHPRNQSYYMQLAVSKPCQ